MTRPLTPSAPLRRAADGRALGGVASGLAAHVGLPVLAVRLGFLALTLASGLGVAAYAVFWVFLPQADGTARPSRPDRKGQGLLLVALLLCAGFLGVVIPLGLLPGWSSTGPLLVVVAGTALVWQQADAAQRDRWRHTASAGPGGLLRLGIGAVLVAAGVVGFLASRGQLAVARAGLLSTVVVVVGIAVLSSPWWFSMASELGRERRERIRSQERAEVAAHLHDSVLQTLTLIQRSADSPTEVTRLARSQERALRTWLYAQQTPSGTLSSALQRVALEVEESTGVPVEVVTVGDTGLDERLEALLAATREAVLNAAHHSGAPLVDVYCEVEDEAVSVFVRDRGCGFDPGAVPADRHGLAGSVTGRMSRHGGTARVRSTPGSGTEVALGLPRG